MADTNKIKTEIEPAIRDWLKTEIGEPTFEERPVKFPSGGSYRFGAVSRDGSIVGAILCNRAKTRTHRNNTDGLRKALAEIEHLKLLGPGINKILVFTDLGFSNLVQRRASRFGIVGIKFLICSLPPDKKLLLDQIFDAAAKNSGGATE